MAFINREAVEPDEKPTELGRHIWQVCQVEHPGEWREVFESDKRELAVRIEGCIVGRGQGRIAPIMDLAGWDARLIERVEADKTLYVVRVRFTPPKKSTQADAKLDGVMDKLRRGEEVDGAETARVDPQRLPVDSPSR